MSSCYTYKSYKDLLEDKSIESSQENILKTRKSISDFLSKNKFEPCNYETVENLNYFEIYTKNIANIELKLPEEFRALEWNQMLNKIKNTERPITLIETVVLQHLDLKSMFKQDSNTYANNTIKIINSDSYNFLPTTKDNTRTVLIYTGSTDETNKTFNIVKTVYENVRDKEFEEKWMATNPRADLYVSSTQINLPKPVEISKNDNNSLCKYPSSFSFEQFLIEKEEMDETELNYMYNNVIREVEIYRTLVRLAKPTFIERSKATTLYKYMTYIKDIYNIDDDEEAISLVLKFVKSKKRSSSVDLEELNDSETKRLRTAYTPATHVYHFEAMQEIYSESDLELQSQNRDKLNSGSKKGYKLLANTNCDTAPFGYDEDGNQIAPFDFKQNGTVRKKASPY